MRHLLAFTVFTALHFAFAFGSLFIGGGLIMAAFDGKGSTVLATIAAVAMDILHFPVVNGLSGLIPGLRGLGTAGQYALFVVNSMVWGAVAAIVWSWWRNRRCVVVGA